MDAELAAAAPHLPQLPFADLAGTREAFAALLAAAPPPDPTGVRVHDRRVPGPAGAPEVPVRVFSPDDGATARPGVLDIHGGACGPAPTR